LNFHKSADRLGERVAAPFVPGKQTGFGHAEELLATIKESGGLPNV
jgi:hypothetical protein